MIKQRFNILALLLVTILLAACGDKACIEADDWGYPKVYVPAERKQLTVLADSGREQIVAPIDSRQVIIDAGSVAFEVTVSDGDQWTSWFGGQGEGNLTFNAQEQVPDIQCQYWLADGIHYDDPDFQDRTPAASDVAYDPRPFIIKGNHKTSCPAAGYQIPYTTPAPGMPEYPTKYADCRVPCWLREGMGLYVGLAFDNGPVDEISITKHIPDSRRPGVVYDPTLSPAQNMANQDKDGYVLRGLPKDEIHGAMTGDRLYFKIVDKFYDDNTGGYTVRLKNGTKDPNPGPLERLVKIFMDPLMMTMERVFKTLVAHQDYITAFRATIALYIVLYGFAFMMGLIRGVQVDAVMRVLKLSVVFVLLGSNAWDFFYNDFFSFFMYGVQTIAGLLISPFGIFDPNNPWFSMDQILRNLFSGETSAKIWSTLLSNSLGFVYIPLLYFGIFLFLKALLRALMLYLVALVAIGVLIILAPIFLLFMLFDKAKEIFDEWTAQFAAFSIQQLIVFAGMGLFVALIVQFMQRTIGYRVCWNTWWSFSLLGIDIFDFKFWLPDVRNKMGSIWMDANGDGMRDVAEFAYRYIDAPYLDPIYDKALFNRMYSGSNFLEISQVLIFISATFLMTRFLEYIPTLAQGLQGGGGKEDYANLFGAGNMLWQSMVNATVGSPNSASDAMIKNSSNRFSRNYYAMTRRDGGILGNFIRGTMDLGRAYIPEQKGGGGKGKGAGGPKGGEGGIGGIGRGGGPRGGSGDGGGLLSGPADGFMSAADAMARSHNFRDIGGVDLNKKGGFSKSLYNTEINGVAALVAADMARRNKIKETLANQNQPKSIKQREADIKNARKVQEARKLFGAALGGRDPRAMKAAADFAAKNPKTMEQGIRDYENSRKEAGMRSGEQATIDRGRQLIERMAKSQGEKQTVSRAGIIAAEVALAKQRAKDINDPFSETSRKKDVINAKSDMAKAEAAAAGKGTEVAKILAENADKQRLKEKRAVNWTPKSINKALNSLGRVDEKIARNEQRLAIAEQSDMLKELGVTDKDGKLAKGIAADSADAVLVGRLEKERELIRASSNALKRGGNVVTGNIEKLRKSIELDKAKEAVLRGKESGAVSEDVAKKMIKSMERKHNYEAKRSLTKALNPGQGRKEEVAKLDADVRKAIIEKQLESGILNEKQAADALKKSERQFNKEMLEAKALAPVIFGRDSLQKVREDAKDEKLDTIRDQREQLLALREKNEDAISDTRLDIELRKLDLREEIARREAENKFFDGELASLKRQYDRANQHAFNQARRDEIGEATTLSARMELELLAKKDQAIDAKGFRHSGERERLNLEVQHLTEKLENQVAREAVDQDFRDKKMSEEMHYLALKQLEYKDVEANEKADGRASMVSNPFGSRNARKMADSYALKMEAQALHERIMADTEMSDARRELEMRAVEGKRKLAEMRADNAKLGHDRERNRISKEIARDLAMSQTQKAREELMGRSDLTKEQFETRTKLLDTKDKLVQAEAAEARRFIGRVIKGDGLGDAVRGSIIDSKEFGYKVERREKMVALADERAVLEQERAQFNEKWADLDEKTFQQQKAVLDAKERLIKDKEFLAESVERHASNRMGRTWLERSEKKHETKVERDEALLEAASLKAGMGDMSDEMRKLKISEAENRAQVLQWEQETFTGMGARALNKWPIHMHDRDVAVTKAALERDQHKLDVQHKIESGEMNSRVGQLQKEIADREFEMVKHEQSLIPLDAMYHRKDAKLAIANAHEEAGTIEIMHQHARGDISEEMALLKVGKLKAETELERTNANRIFDFKFNKENDQRRIDMYDTKIDIQEQREAIDNDPGLSPSLRHLKKMELRRQERDAERDGENSYWTRFDPMHRLESAVDGLGSRIDGAINEHRLGKQERLDEELRGIEDRYMPEVARLRDQQLADLRQAQVDNEAARLRDSLLERDRHQQFRAEAQKLARAADAERMSGDHQREELQKLRSGEGEMSDEMRRLKMGKAAVEISAYQRYNDAKELPDGLDSKNYARGIEHDAAKIEHYKEKEYIQENIENGNIGRSTGQLWQEVVDKKLELREREIDNPVLSLVMDGQLREELAELRDLAKVQNALEYEQNRSGDHEALRQSRLEANAAVDRVNAERMSGDQQREELRSLQSGAGDLSDDLRAIKISKVEAELAALERHKDAADWSQLGSDDYVRTVQQDAALIEHYKAKEVAQIRMDKAEINQEHGQLIHALADKELALSQHEMLDWASPESQTLRYEVDMLRSEVAQQEITAHHEREARILEAAAEAEQAERAERIKAATAEEVNLGDSFIGKLLGGEPVVDGAADRAEQPSLAEAAVSIVPDAMEVAAGRLEVGADELRAHEAEQQVRDSLAAGEARKEAKHLHKHEHHHDKPVDEQVGQGMSVESQPTVVESSGGKNTDSWQTEDERRKMGNLSHLEQMGSAESEREILRKAADDTGSVMNNDEARQLASAFDDDSRSLTESGLIAQTRQQMRDEKAAKQAKADEEKTAAKASAEETKKEAEKKEEASQSSSDERAAKLKEEQEQKRKQELEQRMDAQRARLNKAPEKPEAPKKKKPGDEDEDF